MDYFDKYYEGVFWIPEQESKIEGTLIIDEDGVVTISSIDPIDCKNRNFLDEWVKIDLVYGYLSSPSDTQLFSIKMFDTFKIYGASGVIERHKYRSNKAIITKGIDNEISALSYKNIMFRVEDIEQWRSINGFKHKFGNEPSKLNIEVNYKQPEEIILYKDDIFTVYFYFRAKGGFAGVRKHYINETVYLNIDISKNKDFESTLNIQKLFERLFVTLLGVPFQSYEIDMKSESDKAYHILRKQDKIKPFRGYQVEFKEFVKDSQEVISKWIAIQDDLDLLIRGFFAAFGKDGLLQENKFLNYIAGLEYYYCKRHEKETYLKARLKYLISNSKIAMLIEDIDTYSDKLKSTRHYLAHFETKYKDSSFESSQLVNVNSALEFVIREILLNEIGISSELIHSPNMKVQ